MTSQPIIRVERIFSFMNRGIEQEIETEICSKTVCVCAMCAVSFAYVFPQKTTDN